MQTSPIESKTLRESVIAVPPLARHADLTLHREENAKLIRHIEAGGLTTLLYGGNANFYHLSLNEYTGLITLLEETGAPETLVIPSAGPAFGVMMDQAAILRETRFPTAMVLPHSGMTTSRGVESGIRQFAEAIGKPVVLYLKEENYLDPEGAKRLCDDGLVAFIKYAIVRKNPAADPYLEKLIDLVDPAIIVSGMGEQPAIVHMQEFGLAGFTSGCVCVQPALSQEMLEALRSGDFDRAESIRQVFRPLEDLRNAIHPVRVLHDAVALAGIAETGPILPLLSNLEGTERDSVKFAALTLSKSPRSPQ